MHSGVGFCRHRNKCVAIYGGMLTTARRPDALRASGVGPDRQGARGHPENMESHFLRPPSSMAPSSRSCLHLLARHGAPGVHAPGRLHPSPVKRSLRRRASRKFARPGLTPPSIVTRSSHGCAILPAGLGGELHAQNAPGRIRAGLGPILGPPYGAANRTGNCLRAAPHAGSLAKAADSGSGYFDTGRAIMATARARLGEALRARKSVRTITKLSALRELSPDRRAARGACRRRCEHCASA